MEFNCSCRNECLFIAIVRVHQWPTGQVTIPPSSQHISTLLSILPFIRSANIHSVASVSVSLPDVLLENTKDDTSSALDALTFKCRRQAANRCSALCAPWGTYWSSWWLYLLFLEICLGCDTIGGKVANLGISESKGLRFSLYLTNWMDSFMKDTRVITQFFFFLMSVRGGNTSAQRSHHSRFFIFPAAPAISLSPKTYQAQGTLKRQVHCSGQGGWLGGRVRRSPQSSSLGDTSPVLFSLELPWGGKLGLQPFPHRGL